MEGYNKEEEYFHKKDKELLDALIHQTVWVIGWINDKEEMNIEGAWFHHPSDEEQKEFMKEKHPNQSAWECLEFTIKERI